MSPKDKKKALALIAKIQRAEDMQAKAIHRMGNRPVYGTAWEQAQKQLERNADIAEAAYADLRKLIEAQS